jgi:alkylated DNA repair dioxygenase AlkB
MKNKLFETEDNLLPHHGEVFYYPEFFSTQESHELFTELLNNISWRQEPIKLFGKEIMQPRLTAWYADKGVNYSYSGITMQALDWTESLIKIKTRVEQKSKSKFNSALLNLYRNGNDSMGWHRDNEKELGVNPVIASVSFGVSRKFQMRTYKEKTDLISLELRDGSFLLMQGESQPYWEHSVPKTKKIRGTRINITFRQVMP